MVISDCCAVCWKAARNSLASVRWGWSHMVMRVQIFVAIVIRDPGGFEGFSKTQFCVGIFACITQSSATRLRIFTVIRDSSVACCKTSRHSFVASTLYVLASQGHQGPHPGCHGHQGLACCQEGGKRELCCVSTLGAGHKHSSATGSSALVRSCCSCSNVHIASNFYITHPTCRHAVRKKPA